MNNGLTYLSGITIVSLITVILFILKPLLMILFAIITPFCLIYMNVELGFLEYDIIKIKFRLRKKAHKILYLLSEKAFSRAFDAALEFDNYRERRGDEFKL